ncbi:hypothetical protein [Clostridium sulfidigenes]|uniref:hypothetical protein n=1 Tax=Clostridium sulfidigenes TaxID=318464 RepID=UPI003F89115A
MEEKKNSNEVTSAEYISEREAKTVKELFKKYLKSYKEKDVSVTDKEWLEQLFKTELSEVTDEEAKQDAEEIVESIKVFNSNLQSVNEAATRGISKESWLADKMQEASVGMAVNEYGEVLQSMDNILYQKNMELADALQRSTDGNIKMSPNLDGNIAENMIAKTTELSGFSQGKNIKVEVRDVFTENSVDVRAINLDTGKYQNYQLKFGKDAKATIDLIERGNYNNQQIIVPSEQLEEVKAHFKAKGSSKTITNHIDAWGAKGKKFTKEDMKELQVAAQEDGIMPSMDYSHYQTKDLAMSIGKNAGAMALQAAAVTTGLNVASKIFNGEKVDADEIVEIAIKTGADTSVKVVTAGTLQVAIRKGIISFIPKATPAGVIAYIACVGIENVKILAKIASGELSMTKGLDQMGRVTTSMVGGLWGMAKGAALGAKLTGWIPVVGAPLAVVTGFIGGMVGYFGGSKIGDTIYNAGKKVASAARSVAKAAVNGLKSAGRAISTGISKVGSAIGRLFS